MCFDLWKIVAKSHCSGKDYKENAIILLSRSLSFPFSYNWNYNGCFWHKSIGTDGTHPGILRELAEVLPKPLSIISQRSWLTGEVADDWSLSSGTPIYEKGWKEHPGNYGPGRCEVQQDWVLSPALALQQPPAFISGVFQSFIIRQTCFELIKKKKKENSFGLRHWMVNLPSLISSVPDKTPTTSVLPCNKFVLLGFFPPLTSWFIEIKHVLSCTFKISVYYFSMLGILRAAWQSWLVFSPG